jgi:nucleoside-triphosphatase THEP1
VLQPAIIEDGVKTGSDIVDISDGTSVPFARLKESAPFKGVEVGKYRISLDGIAFAKRVLESSIGSDLILIDEVGPLEFSGGGIVSAARKVLTGEGIHVVVVRKRLLPDYAKFFQDSSYKAFEVTPENRNIILEGILREL